MRVSNASVRIQLIPENAEEKSLLQSLSHPEMAAATLSQLYAKALDSYQPNASIVAQKFMEFPRVALCTYRIGDSSLESKPIIYQTSIFD